MGNTEETTEPTARVETIFHTADDFRDDEKLQNGAERARKSLLQFADEHGIEIGAVRVTYTTYASPEAAFAAVDEEAAEAVRKAQAEQAR